MALLALLYLVQGMPFGFQVAALPVFLFDQGVGIEAIGYSTALALPWAFKFLWAPWVETRGGGAGSRTKWIVPVQVLMAVGFVCASRLALPDQLGALMALLFGLNALAATQDIAVDGLAVDLLPPDELGLGNAAQVVGFKAGMAVAGGILVWLTAWIDWSGAFLSMAGLIVAVAGLLLVVDEPAGGGQRRMDASRGAMEVVSALKDSMVRPGMATIVAVIATYKMGESIIDVMFKPFLMEQGVTASEMGLWLGTWGMAASIVGSVAGGMLAMRFRLLPLLLVAGVVRLLPQCAQLFMAVGAIEVAPWSAIAVALAENAAGGALTTVMFASMMGWVDRTIGASHFTLLACIEVWGKSLSAFLSGVIAAHLGYSGAFALGISLGVVFLVLVRRIHPSQEPAQQRP